MSDTTSGHQHGKVETMRQAVEVFRASNPTATILWFDRNGPLTVEPGDPLPEAPPFTMRAKARGADVTIEVAPGGYVETWDRNAPPRWFGDGRFVVDLAAGVDRSVAMVRDPGGKITGVDTRKWADVVRQAERDTRAAASIPTQTTSRGLTRGPHLVDCLHCAVTGHRTSMTPLDHLDGYRCIDVRGCGKRRVAAIAQVDPTASVVFRLEPDATVTKRLECCECRRVLTDATPFRESAPTDRSGRQRYACDDRAACQVRVLRSRPAVTTSRDADGRIVAPSPHAVVVKGLGVDGMISASCRCGTEFLGRIEHWGAWYCADDLPDPAIAARVCGHCGRVSLDGIERDPAALVGLVCVDRAACDARCDAMPRESSIIDMVAPGVVRDMLTERLRAAGVGQPRPPTKLTRRCPSCGTADLPTRTGEPMRKTDHGLYFCPACSWHPATMAHRFAVGDRVRFIDEEAQCRANIMGPLPVSEPWQVMELDRVTWTGGENEPAYRIARETPRGVRNRLTVVESDLEPYVPRVGNLVHYSGEAIVTVNGKVLPPMTGRVRP